MSDAAGHRPVRFHLVRHGRASRDGEPTDDPGLGLDGREQAHAYGIALHARLAEDEIVRFVASPVRRAIETAATVHAALERRLRDEGGPRVMVVAPVPDRAWGMDGADHQDALVAIASVQERPPHRRAGGREAETAHSAVFRASPSRQAGGRRRDDDTESDPTNAREHVVAVTHEPVLRAFLAVAFAPERPRGLTHLAEIEIDLPEQGDVATLRFGGREAELPLAAGAA